MNFKESQRIELYRWTNSTDSAAAAKNVKELLHYVAYMEERCEKIATLLRQEMVARVNAEQALKRCLAGCTKPEEVPPPPPPVVIPIEELIEALPEEPTPPQAEMPVQVTVAEEQPNENRKKKGRNR